MNTYKITVKHDTGKIVIRTIAQNEQAAKNMVMAAEGCPECAIVKVAMIEKEIYVCLYSTDGMRERHFDNEQDALTFAATVKGAVCPFKMKIKNNKAIPAKH